MKNFKQFLIEDYVDTAKNRMGGLGDIFLNPSRKEIMEVISYGMIKAIIPNNHSMYVFSPNLMHMDVLDHMRLNYNNVVTIEIDVDYPKSKTASVFITSTNTTRVKNNPETVPKILSNTFLIKTFNIVTVMDSLGQLMYTKDQHENL